MTNQITNVVASSNTSYKFINDFMSANGDVELLDYLYPEHDGEYIAERAAELMELRQVCYSLRNACEIIMEKLNRVIPED